MNFDLVGEDRHVGQLHGSVLGELLRMVGRRATLQDEAGRQEDDAKIADPVAEPPYQQGFEAFLVGGDIGFECLGAHKTTCSLERDAADPSTLMGELL